MEVEEEERTGRISRGQESPKTVAVISLQRPNAMWPREGPRDLRGLK
jgi:hypothetical protein